MPFVKFSRILALFILYRKKNDEWIKKPNMRFCAGKKRTIRENYFNVLKYV